MQVHYQLEKLPDFKNAAITIGSFDGLHLGHQQLIRRVNRLAASREGESVVITFHPHPRQIVYPNDKSLRLLTSIKEKVALFEQFRVDHLVIVPFTVEFSQLSADEYIKDFLHRYFKPACIVIGYDHRFGLNRQGDINFLKWYGDQLDYEVIQIEPQEVADITVSSTKIRNALIVGEIDNANQLLGHRYQLTGKVVKGRQIGRTIGFPTANIDVDNPYKLIPAEGIYAAQARWGNQFLEGMLYIGQRPTLDDGRAQTIELNIFDFDHDLYVCDSAGVWSSCFSAAECGGQNQHYAEVEFDLYGAVYGGD
ncbi:MAG: bifunctional riboflavin kinase/FAD synthetase, partial [Bacteroidota bacterium]